MTIDALVQMAKRIHDVEGWDLGSPARQGLTPEQGREKRNQFWAFVIGCAYWGHPVYNKQPDTQWHLKKGDPTRPQTDDVATSMPSRNHWDCIPGAGADGYSFAATPHGPLPAEQIVYAPPKPDGSTPEPVPPSSTIPSYEALGGDEGAKKISRVLGHDYRAAGRSGLDDECGNWIRRTDYDFLSGKIAPVEASIAAHRDEWLEALGLIVDTPPGMMSHGKKCLICGASVGYEKSKPKPISHVADCVTR